MRLPKHLTRYRIYLLQIWFIISLSTRNVEEESSKCCVDQIQAQMFPDMQFEESIIVTQYWIGTVDCIDHMQEVLLFDQMLVMVPKRWVYAKSCIDTHSYIYNW